MTREKFLSVLFEPWELKCFTDTIYGTALFKVPKETDIFFSINPLSTSRADNNVLAYRNFLLELDNVSLEKQVALVTSRLPVSSIVFSGNKSYHFIISLTEPVANREVYDRVYRGLFEAVPEADKACKNPSRLSRLPFATRPETRLMQELLYLGQRVDVNALPKPSKLVEFDRQETQQVTFVSKLLQQALQNPDNYIEQHFSGRNQFFYWVGKRCTELRHTRPEKKLVVDRIYDKMKNKRNFTLREAYAAARVKF